MPPRTRRQAIDKLRSHCERTLSHLNALVTIHMELDPATRAVGPDDDRLVYRLRKILLHVNSVTGWQLDTEVMHVLAPELRAALEQIEKIGKEAPVEQKETFASENGIHPFEIPNKLFHSDGEMLAPYIHPTPQNLLLAKEFGGLGPGDEIRYYVHLSLCLNSLLWNYALCVNRLSEILKCEMTSQIASVMKKAAEEYCTMTPGDYLQFLAEKKLAAGDNVSNARER